MAAPARSAPGNPGALLENPARFSISSAGGDSHRLVDRRPPLGVALVDAADQVHVRAAELLRDRAHLPGAERETVGREDRRGLPARAAGERLRGAVQLGAPGLPP